MNPLFLAGAVAFAALAVIAPKKSIAEPVIECHEGEGVIEVVQNDETVQAVAVDDTRPEDEVCTETEVKEDESAETSI